MDVCANCAQMYHNLDVMFSQYKIQLCSFSSVQVPSFAYDVLL